MSLKGKLAHVEVSDVGKVRDHNEDAIGTQPDIGLWVLADGMGGYNAGEVASGIAVKTILEMVTAACKTEKRGDIESGTGYMRQTIVLRDAILRANKVINQTAQSHPVRRHGHDARRQLVLRQPRLDRARRRLADARLRQPLRADHDGSLAAAGTRRPRLLLARGAQRSTNAITTRALGVEANVDVEVKRSTFRRATIS